MANARAWRRERHATRLFPFNARLNAREYANGSLRFALPSSRDCLSLDQAEARLVQRPGHATALVGMVANPDGDAQLDESGNMLDRAARLW